MHDTTDGEQGWERLLPRDLGALPFRQRLTRTEPRGPTPAPIAIVGLYPAVTVKKRWSGGGGRWLPFEVEARSFEGSRSAAELETKFLAPLGLDPSKVFLIDRYPYCLANAARGASGRTMWDNIVAYQEVTKEDLAIRCRPSLDEMVDWCRDLPGNEERLAHWFGCCKPRLVITLGAEAAAFARRYRGEGAVARARDDLYVDPTTSTAFGPSPLKVVHRAHPGILMRANGGTWNRKHEEWCAGKGTVEVARAMREWVAGGNR